MTRIVAGASSEAEASYLAEIASDCARVLGDGIELVALIREIVFPDKAPAARSGGVAAAEPGDRRPPRARLVARYRLHGRAWETDAVGDTLLEAHAALREQLVIDRIRIGFTDLVEPGRG